MDLSLSVQTVAKQIEQEYKAHSLNIAIQDGALAGQSVPHVHVHLIPRHKQDFEPIDEVYTALDSANIAADYASRQLRRDRKVFGVDDDERKPRSEQEMKMEAMKLANLFPESNRGIFEE